LVTLSTDGKIALWDPKLLLEFDQELSNAKPQKVIKSNHRLLCVSISQLDQEDKIKKPKKDGALKKRKKKLTRDEKEILKRQKLNHN
jgi:hypothetical protein